MVISPGSVHCFLESKRIARMEKKIEREAAKVSTSFLRGLRLRLRYLRVALSEGDVAWVERQLGLLRRLVPLERDLQELCQSILALGEVIPDKKSPALVTGPTMYLCSSLFLHHCLSHLTQDEGEALHEVTGVRYNNILSLDRLLPLKASSRSLTHAEAEPEATFDNHILLDRFGLALHGVFHSHPGRGPGAVAPSERDMRCLERVERGGYPAIGAVFSRDGYVRFFSKHRPFEILIYGKGVEKVGGERLFRLREAGSLPNFSS